MFAAYLLTTLLHGYTDRINPVKNVVTSVYFICLLQPTTAYYKRGLNRLKLASKPYMAYTTAHFGHVVSSTQKTRLTFL